MHDVSDLGPGKFKTCADSGTEQICYYNTNKTDTSFNYFLAVRQQTSQASEINFSVVKVIDNTKRNNVIYLEVGDELSNLKNDNIQSTIQ